MPTGRKLYPYPIHYLKDIGNTVSYFTYMGTLHKSVFMGKIALLSIAST
jgi:hypothetical protein